MPNRTEAAISAQGVDAGRAMFRQTIQSGPSGQARVGREGDNGPRAALEGLAWMAMNALGWAADVGAAGILQ